MSDAKRSLKQKILHEMRECLVIALYLFVVLSLLSVHKSMILAQYHIDFAIHGVALINALALSKVILVAQDLHLADQIRNAPLIYPTLVKSFAFTVVLAIVKIAEDAVVGRFRGESFHASLSDLEGGSWPAILTLMGLIFVMLIPFFAFTELRRVFGSERLIGVFFRPRYLLNLPQAGS